MTGQWQQILSKYGQNITLYRQDGEEQSADFFQQLPTPLGLVRRDRWICLGGPDMALDQLGDGYIAWGGETFTVRSAQPVYLGEELVYWWGLLAVREQA